MPLAIINWGHQRQRWLPIGLAWTLLFQIRFVCALGCSFCGLRLLAENDSAFYARTNYPTAEKRYEAQPLDNQAAWQFARACFDLADVASNRTEQAAIAERGIAAAREVVRRAPDLVQGHYYLGMDLGELAETKTLGALKLVREMEREFKAAKALDERFDYAGPDRNLGLLYRDAPSVGSIGSRSKARQHLQRALALAPAYPENHLNLIEAYVRWGEWEGARRQLNALDELWPSARASFEGPAWASSWADWQARLAKLKKQLSPVAG
ncbi:MAG TPA: tetratricopeptide repeat protein [Candidatus Acidoferrum sp.]|nr:tetratricopeptide repeat protein [Candidatus Acidoferrum sp.]